MVKRKNRIEFHNYGEIDIVSGSSSHSFPKHSHNAFIIGMVTNGRIKLEIGNQEGVLEKGDVYMIPPFTEHKILAIEDMLYGYTVVCLKHNIAGEFRNIKLHRNIYRCKALGNEISDALKELTNFGDYDKFKRRIISILNETIKNGISSRKEECNTVLIAAAYIREHLDQPFDLMKLSDHVNFSKYHLLRLFKMQMGAAPYQYYIQEKLRRIKQGLSNRQTPVFLAADMNFSDQSHLCNTFRKHTGLSPVQYKRNYRKYNIKEEPE